MKTSASDKRVKLTESEPPCPWGRESVLFPVGAEPALSSQRESLNTHKHAHAHAHTHVHNNSQPESEKEARLYQPLKDQESQKTSFKKERSQEKKLMDDLGQNFVARRLPSSLDSEVLRQRA